MLATAFLTITAATEHARRPAPADQIPLTRTKSPGFSAHWSSSRHQPAGTACDGRHGGDATSAALKPATTSGKPGNHEDYEVRLGASTGFRFRQPPHPVPRASVPRHTDPIAGPVCTRTGTSQRWAATWEGEASTAIYTRRSTVLPGQHLCRLLARGNYGLGLPSTRVTASQCLGRCAGRTGCEPVSSSVPVRSDRMIMLGLWLFVLRGAWVPAGLQRLERRLSSRSAPHPLPNRTRRTLPCAVSAGRAAIGRRGCGPCRLRLYE